MNSLSVEQVKASVRLEDVVRQRGVHLRASQNGNRLEGHCPLHPGDETPSFNMYINSQRYHCFGCGADGDVIDFVQAYDGCSFQDALHRLAGSMGTLSGGTRLLRPVVSVPIPMTEEKSHAQMLTRIQRHYHQALLTQSTLKQEIQRTRGITEEGIRLCSLGYADGTLAPLIDTTEMRQEAQQIGVLSATQWERLWMRLIIPEYVDGQCVWMIGRTVYQPQRSRGNRKYLGLSLPKPLLGYGLACTRIREGHPVRAILIVEGAIDYVLASQWNLPIVCVALVGTHASRRQLAMLLDLQQRTHLAPLLISLDADEAGRLASEHLLTHLRQRTSRVTELAPIANAKDIGDLGIQADGPSFLRTALELALSAETLQGGKI